MIEIASEDVPLLDHLVIEDDKPVESLFIAKQHCLLTSPLHSFWTPPGEGKLWAETNVGLFFEPKNPGYCPDMMLALDIEIGDDFSSKANLSYFVWLRGKAQTSSSKSFLIAKEARIHTRCEFMLAWVFRITSFLILID